MDIKQFAEHRRKQRTRCLREMKLSKRRKRNNYSLEDCTVQKFAPQKPKRKPIIVVLYER
jgi:hypothetical protein